MKKTIFTMVMLACVLIAVSCDNTEKEPIPGQVSKKAQEALMAKYSGATNISWKIKGKYVVANFSITSRSTKAEVDHSAWFDNSGEWYMTETDILFDDLPEAVQRAFRTSEYSKWRVDEVDRLERKGVETIYVIEVEGTKDNLEMEYDLYYSTGGILIKKIADASDDYDYDDYIPSKPVTGVDNYLRMNYPDARIIDIDCENGMTEVEILDDHTCREPLFDRNGNWVYTKTETRHTDVLEIVMQALESSEYREYRIDDIDHYKTADNKEYYRFELESRNRDVKVDITPTGELTVVGPGNASPGHGNGEIVGGGIAKFIENKYPGAVIREQDYDDGWLKVEIWHEKREKSIYFNGANEWVYTEWDISYGELPKAIEDTIATSDWKEYRIDDIEFVQTPTGDYYSLELEFGEHEVTLHIDAKGQILR